LFLALGLVLVLVAGLGITGWLYFTGRFGVGPLSAADEAAGRAIEENAAAPVWADEGDVECAVDDLVEEHRSDGLEQKGLVEGGGDDWSYTDEWETDDATAYVELLLDCSDGWAGRVGEEWGLDDTGCLEEIDTDTLAAYFAAETVTFTDAGAAEEARKQGVEALDECYATEPPAPSVEAEAAYRAVRFTFSEPEGEAGKVVLNIDRDGSWRPLRRSTVRIDTEEGGRRGCVSAQTVATYPWGTELTAEKEFCGESKPRRIWWAKADCTTSPGCYAFALKYEGFKAFDTITATYTSDGGDCLSTSGSCSDTVLAEADGRGTIVTWSFPGSYDGRFVGKVGRFEVAIPN
jgi:hypothetical protein